MRLRGIAFVVLYVWTRMRPWALLVMFVVAASLVARDAGACGMFARAPGLAEAELLASTPYLAVERSLVVWDRETKMEDFVREARFERADQSFGFVVPTPTEPTISGVKNAPFDRLQKKMPYVSRSGEGRGLGGAKGSGGGVPAPAEAVVVLAQQRVGSFEAFTLRAEDAGAFDRWLKDNGFVAPEEAKAWLRHYVELKFYFVAFKFVGRPGATKGMTSETVRLRFTTPKPYYPYMDATNPHGAEALRHRVLLGWTITRDAMIDVAAKPMDEKRWHRPWAYGPPTDATRAEVEAVLGPELSAVVPRAEKLVVQPFRDRKASREGYGDVLLVPATKSEVFTPEDKEAHRFLLGVVDPVLIGEKGVEPTVYVNAGTAEPPDAAPAPARSAPAAPGPGGASCAASPGAGRASGVWLVGLAMIAFARRRAWLLALGLLACKKPGAAIPAEASVVASSSAAVDDNRPAISVTRPLSRVEREVTAFDVMMGEVPSIGITEDPDERPAPRIDVTMETSTEGATIMDAGRVVAGLRGRFRQCFTQAVMSNAELAKGSAFVIKLVVGPNGEVKTSSIEPKIDVLSACLVDHARRVQFDAPTPPAEATVTARLSFKLPP